MRSYLGDSVYAEFANGMLTLTAEDGIGAMNTIYLEPEVVEALMVFLRRCALECPPPPAPRDPGLIRVRP